MKARRWILITVLAALGLLYVTLFTEWLRPAPIEIASQVRLSIQPPRFRRPAQPFDLLKQQTTLQPGPPGQQIVKVEKLLQTNQVKRVPLPAWGPIDPAPGGVANVTFSLDRMYSLTALRVEDVPANGATPKVVWQLTGESQPTQALLYGRTPEGMKPTVPGANAEPLVPGAPYRLILQAGRRRGTNSFTTAPIAARAAE